MAEHTFALHIPHLTSHDIASKQIIVKDKLLYHRLINVLRFKPGDSCIVFDKYMHCTARLESINKKDTLSFVLESCSTNQELTPHITFLLPLLKREAFEQLLYSLVEIGVNDIQIVITHKCHRQSLTPKEFERAQQIMIAAAEQSKNFAFPNLYKPQSLEALLEQMTARCKLFFDPQGKKIGPILQEEKKSYALLIGPEGDLTQEEKIVAEKSGFDAICLTPTVLRAQQAGALAAGIIRSI